MTITDYKPLHFIDDHLHETMLIREATVQTRPKKYLTKGRLIPLAAPCFVRSFRPRCTEKTINQK